MKIVCATNCALLHWHKRNSCTNTGITAIPVVWLMVLEFVQSVPGYVTEVMMSPMQNMELSSVTVVQRRMAHVRFVFSEFSRIFSFDIVIILTNPFTYKMILSLYKEKGWQFCVYVPGSCQTESSLIWGWRGIIQWACSIWCWASPSIFLTTTPIFTFSRNSVCKYIRRLCPMSQL